MVRIILIINIMTITETNFLLWAFGVLLAILGFVGALGVNAIIKMAKDLGEIKTTIAKIDEKHNNLENIIEHQDKRIEKIEDKIFI